MTKPTPTGLQAHDALLELGGWNLREHLGAGAFGQVILADRRTVAGDLQKVAIKLVVPRDPSSFPGKNKAERAQQAVLDFNQKVQSIVREFQLLQRIDSPFIAPVIDSGRKEVDFYGVRVSLAWIALQYIPGQSLQEEINTEGVLSKSEWFDLAHDLLMAAVAAHDAGVINSDIKPDNVMRSSRRTLLIDFGVGSVVGAQEFSGGGGTFGYRAPEQLNPKPDKREEELYESDVFSIGATLVYAGTGMRPWDYPDIPQMPDANRQRAVMAERLHAVMNTQAPRLEGLDSDQRDLVVKMLATSPRKRPTAGDALAMVRSMMADGNPRKTGDISFERLRTVPQGRPNPKVNSRAVKPEEKPEGDAAASDTRPEAPQKPERQSSDSPPQPVVKIIRERSRRPAAKKDSPAGRLVTTVLLALLVPVFGAASRFYFLEQEKRRDYASQFELKFAATLFSYWTFGIGGFLVCRRWAQRGGSKLVNAVGWAQGAIIPLVLVGFGLSGISAGVGDSLAFVAFFLYPIAPIVQIFVAPSWEQDDQETSPLPASDS